MKGVKPPASAGSSWSVGGMRCQLVEARQPEEQGFFFFFFSEVGGGSKHREEQCEVDVNGRC